MGKLASGPRSGGGRLLLVASTGVSQITAPKQLIIKRLPQTDDELWWTVQALWGKCLPRTPVCKGHSTPFQAFADAYFARAPVAVWKASRGFGGKSRTLGLLGLTEITLLGAEANVLGGSAAQSLNVKATAQEAWSHYAAPRSMLVNQTTFDTVLSNGGHMRALTASQTSVRGPHPSRLRMDEIDEMDLDILEAAQGQPMRKIGPHGMIETQTVMSSTHQYPDKTMTEMLKRAKTNGWPIYEWCWRETSNLVDGWLSPEEIARKRVEIPQHMWETEYDLQEPSIEGRAIDTEAVERYFDPDLGEFSGDRKVMAEGTPHGHYVTGVDWAKKVDQTIVVTFDASQFPWVVVAWQKLARAPWPYMVREAIKQWEKYGGLFVHDATGVGDVVGDIIKEEVPRAMSNNVTSVVMSAGRDRQNMFSEYIGGIENDELRSPRIHYAYDEHRYVTVDDLYGRGHPPDSVVAGALAWMKRRGRVSIGSVQGGVRPGSPWKV